jgi:hypothetical protein
MIIWSVIWFFDHFFYRVQGGALFATKLALRFFAEHALWPNTNTFPSIGRHSNS